MVTPPTSKSNDWSHTCPCFDWSCAEKTIWEIHETQQDVSFFLIVSVALTTLARPARFGKRNRSIVISIWNTIHIPDIAIYFEERSAEPVSIVFDCSRPLLKEPIPPLQSESVLVLPKCSVLLDIVLPTSFFALSGNPSQDLLSQATVWLSVLLRYASSAGNCLQVACKLLALQHCTISPAKGLTPLISIDGALTLTFEKVLSLSEFFTCFRSIVGRGSSYLWSASSGQLSFLYLNVIWVSVSSASFNLLFETTSSQLPLTPVTSISPDK